MGPTASGKTDLAIKLAQVIPCEIVSVDSAMIYRGMNIGTAKPSRTELAAVPHHLIDIRDPIESYSVAQFCDDALNLINEIIGRGRIPLLVGGTMMYFNALQQGLSSLPEASMPIRELLLQDINRFGTSFLHQTLARFDKASAEKIHPNDSQRIQRALEVYLLSRKPLSAHLNENVRIKSLECVNFILMPSNRAWLHDRIASRFVDMLQHGFIDEVTCLLKQWHLTVEHPSMRCVGYRQVLEYLNGQYDHLTLKEKGIAATRQLAKRQLTWLRHWQNAQFLEAEGFNHIDKIVEFLRLK